VHNDVARYQSFIDKNLHDGYIYIAVRELYIPNKLIGYSEYRGYSTLNLQELDRPNKSKIITTFPFVPSETNAPYTKFEEKHLRYYKLQTSTFPFFLNVTLEDLEGNQLPIADDLPVLIYCQLKISNHLILENMEELQVICSSEPTDMFRNNTISNFKVSLPPVLQNKNLSDYTVSLSSIILPQNVIQEKHARMWIDGKVFIFNVKESNTINAFAEDVTNAIKQDDNLKGSILCAKRQQVGRDRGFLIFKRVNRGKRSPPAYRIELDNTFLLVCGQSTLRDVSFSLSRKNPTKIIHLSSNDLEAADPNNVKTASVFILTSNLVNSSYVGGRKESVLQLVHLTSMRGSMFQPKVVMQHPICGQVSALQFTLKDMNHQELYMHSDNHVLITLSFFKN
jgi:hypothetical protein